MSAASAHHQQQKDYDSSRGRGDYDKGFLNEYPNDFVEPAPQPASPAEKRLGGRSNSKPIHQSRSTGDFPKYEGQRTNSNTGGGFTYHPGQGNTDAAQQGSNLAPNTNRNNPYNERQPNTGSPQREMQGRDNRDKDYKQRNKGYNQRDGNERDYRRPTNQRQQTGKNVSFGSTPVQDHKETGDNRRNQNYKSGRDQNRDGRRTNNYQGGHPNNRGTMPRSQSNPGGGIQFNQKPQVPPPSSPGNVEVVDFKPKRRSSNTESTE